MVVCLERSANLFACGPADVTATPSSLAPVKFRTVYLSGASLPRLSWKKAVKMDVVVVFIYTHDVVHVPWTHLTQHLKLHLDRFSRFCTAHGRKSLYFTVCVRTRLKIRFSPS